MYLLHYGLRELPFQLTPDPRYLFLTAPQREALSNLQYGLLAAKPLTLLIAEAGTGKTTLIHAALESERCRHVRCVYISNPLLTPEDFVRTLAMKFEFTATAPSKAVLLDTLERHLRERRERGEVTALVVDEAQSLTPELLEEIRLLANIETHTEKLLPLVLAGQPELADRLEHPSLRQLKQRVTLRCELPLFEQGDTALYIASRIMTAGGVPSQLFTLEAVLEIHRFSCGIPRTINVICDNALVTGMALGRDRIDRRIVAEVCRDLRLQPPFENAAPDAGARAMTEPIRSALVADDRPRGERAQQDGTEESEAPDVPQTRRQSWVRLRAAVSLRPHRIVTE